MEIEFKDKPNLIILLIGNEIELRHFIRKFKLSEPFNINDFFRWIRWRNIFFYAYSSNRYNFHAILESHKINRSAKGIHRYYSKEMLCEDLEENCLIPFNWRNVL